MLDHQHYCQAFVGSSVLLCKPGRLRVALSATAGSLSAVSPLLIEETVFLLMDFRQVSERQELAHKSTCPIVTCPEPEVADLDFEFPCICGLGAGLLRLLLR